MADSSAIQYAASASNVGLLALLDDGLDALELGLGLFDADLRLVDCNRLFRRIRGYPAALCRSGTPLADLLSHDRQCGQLAHIGQGNPVRGWLEKAERRLRHSVESRLDDGRAIAMALTPIGDQGVILTVSDVTQRREVEEA